MMTRYMAVIAVPLLAMLWPVRLSASEKLDAIRRALERSSVSRLQEKVYVHTDNMCYFIGDTLWYKAYVVGAGDLRPTDMSRILYVELLTPDGIVAERQSVIVSPDGFTCGNFAIKDSLYSGYYELRAYTRWMLNFNVTEHRYTKDDAHYFYNNRMAADYFRHWEGLYSRVFPVYERPDSAGDYAFKRMYSRHKQRISSASKPALKAVFFPEGGTMTVGVPCRVAFELTDEQGAAVDIQGKLTGDGISPTEISTTYMGRGVFSVTPAAGRLRASFSWQGRDYSFALPAAEPAGVSLRLSGRGVEISSSGMPAGEYGLSVLCRGVLRHFTTFTLGASGHASLTLPDSLPAGVNDVTLFDGSGRILADRLFFVRPADGQTVRVAVDGNIKATYSQYEEITLDLVCDRTAGGAPMSVSVRDAGTDEPTYDNGNIMTDLLLGSELRGFVADPSYYFAEATPERDAALDLLMMVQGWRRYKWSEYADTVFRPLRYTPEKTLTVEGSAHKSLAVYDVENGEARNWRYGQFNVGIATDTAVGVQNENFELGDISQVNGHLGVNHPDLKKEVLVEAEIIFGTEVLGSTQLTHDGGRYLFEIPPYYGEAILKMKAYKEKDSLRQSMTSGKVKGLMDDTAMPDYYVKRDLFYPIYSDKYDYYRTHAPENYGGGAMPDGSGDSLLFMERDVHMLGNVSVSGRRRGKRGIDFEQPACVTDAYELYNNITDYGLSYGMFDRRMFPVQVARFLYGNMGRRNRFNIDSRIDGYTYFRSYVPDMEDAGKTWTNRNEDALLDDLGLRRLQEVRIYSDYEPRNEDAPIEQDRYNADVTVEMVPFADDAVQPAFRDRHIILPGLNEPADFYNPDYSVRRPAEPADYRRTLYWNPNAHADADGRLRLRLFNNGKTSALKISVAGITPDGRFMVY